MAAILNRGTLEVFILRALRGSFFGALQLECTRFLAKDLAGRIYHLRDLARGPMPKKLVNLKLPRKLRRKEPRNLKWSALLAENHVEKKAAVLCSAGYFAKWAAVGCAHGLGKSRR